MAREGRPTDLLNPRSGLSIVIRLIGQKDGDQGINWPLVLSETKQAITKDCPAYKPYDKEDHCICCKSGETGQPFRGKICRSCPVSQISSNGMFVGESCRRHSPTAAK